MDIGGVLQYLQAALLGALESCYCETKESSSSSVMIFFF
jgi:hypothetical protein